MTTLAYDDRGAGEPVLFIAGRGGAGRTWHLYQVPAFLKAGYRTITFDNRGIGDTADATGFGIEDMVADTVELIEKLGIAPTRVVGVSMGSFIAQELMVAHPELVSDAVLMATRGRDDYAREFFRRAGYDLFDAGIKLPPTFDARMRLLENFSPRTLNDDKAVREWIEIFTMWPTEMTPGARCHLDVSPKASRLQAYSAITSRVLVMGFADDVVLPTHLGMEVAQAIPRARYLEIADTGHLGFVERPEVVNAAVLDFFNR